MIRHLSKTLALLLVLAMVMGMLPTAFAAQRSTEV